MPCIRSIGVTIDGAIPRALIAMICSWLIEPSASLPVLIELWMEASRSAGSCRSVPSLTMTAPMAFPPSPEAESARLAFSPTGTIETSGASGSASCSSR